MKKQIVFLLTIFATIALPLNAKLTHTQKRMSADYTVQSGDTLYTIARRYHISIRDVLEANHLERGSVIKVGQVLHIPLNTYTPSPKKRPESPSTKKRVSKPGVSGQSTQEYTVQNGDTLYTIARSHHTSIGALLKANNLERHSVIKVGQRLVIPADTRVPGTPRKQTTVQVAHSASATPAPAAKTQAAVSLKGTYTVQRGDTLFSIARKNHIVISKLMRYNHIGLADRLHVGQILKVSAQSSFVAAAPSRPKAVHVPKKKKLPVGAMPSYTVKKGDTLWRIAQKHHLTLAQIRKLNKMSKKDRIHVGMVLAVGKAVQPERKTYTVKKGDTLWLIAKKNHMSTKQLRKLNGMHRKDRIHVGMVLALAKGVKLPSSTAAVSDQQIIARLKKRGVKKNDIAAVLARIKKSKKKHPDISAILAQFQKEKKQKTIKTPLRVAKSKKKKKSRMNSALAMLNGGGSRSSWSGSNSKVIRVAKRYLGRRYVWGAEGPRSFDCSGFTQYVMRKSKGVRLPRISRKQAYYGKYVSRSHLRPGDLIFFDTSRRRRGYVNHVGIYIGNNKFIHASSARHRVVITSLNRPFYSARFKWGRRIN